jgi:UDP-glucuronate 4-epimerase
MPTSVSTPKHSSDPRSPCYLVTGGAGFIGSHVCDALLALGARVVCVDNFDGYYSRAEKERQIAACRLAERFVLIEADIRDVAAMENALHAFQPDAVIHLAARAGVRPSIEDPLTYEDVNVRGTVNLLEAVRRNGIRNLVFASSSSVYGNRTDAPFREEDNTDLPLSPYGATKKAGETLCYTYHHLYGLTISCLRFFTVYGPRQRPDLAIRKFVTKALKNEPLPLYGDGSSRRDYTHIRDILSGILGAIRWGEDGEPRYGIFNLGSSTPIMLRELVERIESAVARPLQREFLPPQPGDVLQTYANTDKAERELGYRQAVKFDDGLKEFVGWMKERLNGEA